MASQLQIIVREMPHSAALEAAIRRKAAGLERVHPRITAIRATVSAPHQHHHQGNLFTVKLDVMFPGGEILVNRDHAEDVYIALRDAFLAARRQLVAGAQRGQGSGKPRRRRGLAASRTNTPADE